MTAGLVTSPAAKIEASVFRGREPDQERWGFEVPALDSFSARVSINPTRALAVQVSGGVLRDAERLHPGADVSRVTASAMYAGAWRALALDATLAWGRNKRTTSVVPVPGGFFVYPGSVTHAAL